MTNKQYESRAKIARELMIKKIQMENDDYIDEGLLNKLLPINVPIPYIAEQMNVRPERLRGMIKNGLINLGTYSENPNGRDSFYCSAIKVYEVLRIIYEPALRSVM